MNITIFHNARCSNSRGALALIQDAGFTPTVIDYLQSPPSVDELKALVKACGLPVRELMRSKEAVYSELNLGDATLSEDALIAAIHAHPVLLNRPIVVTPKGTRLCRPPELVRELLP
ncbi:arsenate reductase (glutaredoxin) [Ideonella paludis]|uniref:Arsenate reductase n=1 Tax=Ideonella paludis TaxID=1233411 RepID=A0ABS5DUQ2_9BURK|nr:arsenate reductase (glutaredoxin) [Ideonella paludis]MBQ0934871.1 arsenate reductase (glutaredoxin) [Ideonella paludis]